MTATARPAACILVASDDATDAALVKKLLTGAFASVFTSTEEDKAVEDFDTRLPQVLVLAFNTLAKAERYCLRLYRLSSNIHSRPHRTVILCDKAEVREVAELCIKRSFDDYVLFWPMNHDAPRLHMAVHAALRQIAALEDAGPSAAEFAGQAQRLSELEGLLEQQLAVSGQRIETASLAIERAEEEIGAALDREVAGLQRARIRPPFRAAAESMQPLKRWVDALRQECAPHLESARALSEMAQRAPPTVLMVDDDPFQQKLVAKLLETQNCRLVFAASGAEALNLAGKIDPDLILMDVLMPGMDGIETTRRLKAIPRFAKVPVIMVTGKSEGSVVVHSLKAGAADFVVKPFDRDALIPKVARWSRTTALPSARSLPS